MFSMCSELTPRAPILDRRIAQFMQPWADTCTTLFLRADYCCYTPFQHYNTIKMSFWGISTSAFCFREQSTQRTKSERCLNHADLFRRSYLYCEVRESDGRDVNSALKNNIEGIIIKWTHQVFVNCVLVFFPPSTRYSWWIRCCLRNLCYCICLFLCLLLSLRTAGGRGVIQGVRTRSP